MTRPFAFLLEPRPVERPWGGHRIPDRYGWPAGDAVIGEWWLASCHPGATTMLRGAGLDLAQWLADAGRVLGYSPATFPLLLKFLDCEQILSVQVHPSDEAARRQGLSRGKTEAWHILAAEDDAHVYMGTAEGVAVSDLVDRIEQGADNDEVRSMLRSVKVQAGDTLLVEAGTVHAIDAGLALFEVQQNSDTTYRLYDWGRGRDVHLQPSRESLVDHPAVQPIRKAPAADRWTPLIRGHAFSLWRSKPDYELDFEPLGPFAFITALAGEGELVSATETHDFRAGDTALVVGEATLIGDDFDLLAVEPAV